MNTLFEIASRASTPLALGGFLAAALFLIFRQIVAKDIFPRLTKAVGAEILKQIIDRLFLLALLAVVLGFVGFILTRTKPASAQGEDTARPLAEAPTLLSPADGAILTQASRTTQLAWSGLDGARSYALEIESQDPPDSAWHPYPLGPERRIVQGTTFSFEFVGSKSGRWRVSAVGDDGKPGRSSAWSHFVYESEEHPAAATEPAEARTPVHQAEESRQKVEPSSPGAEGRKVLSRERTAGEVLAVLAESPVWDRERAFKDHFKDRWPPGTGWSGTVDGDPRANEAGGCDLVVVERGTRTRIFAHGPAKACDARNRDRVTVAGPIIAFTTDMLTMHCVKVVIE